MSEETIWYKNGKQKVGPFSFSTIKELREKNAISDETLVTCDDGTTWTAYDKFLELKNACKVVSGTFTLLWHNNQLATKAERDLYISIIK